MIEGDTPSFLSLIDNGLVAYMSPSFGGWGGRYIWRQPWLESRPYWTNGRSSRDTVVGTDGKNYTSDQATIWRWRQAYMHDFAARMEWTIADVAHANHNPSVVVNGQQGKAPLAIEARVGTPVTLDATGTTDPDGNTLQYAWFFYPEAGTGVPSASGGPGGSSGGGPAPAAPVAPPSSTANTTTTAGRGGTAPVQSAIPPAPPGGRPTPPPRVTITAASSLIATAMPNTAGTAHIILAVTDSGTPSLTSYRRVILTIK